MTATLDDVVEALAGLTRALGPALDPAQRPTWDQLRWRPSRDAFGVVDPHAATLSNGFPGPVAPNELIESAWGNATSTTFETFRKSMPVYGGVTGSSGTSGGNLANIQVYNHPATLPAGVLLVWSHLRCDFNGGTSYTISMRIDTTTTLVQRSFRAAEIGTGMANTYVDLVAAVAIAANTAKQIQVRGDGTANIQVFADGTVNRLDTLFVPNKLPAAA